MTTMSTFEAAWFSGIIPALGAGGPGFDSPSGPDPLFISFHTVLFKDLRVAFL